MNAKHKANQIEDNKRMNDINKRNKIGNIILPTKSITTTVEKNLSKLSIEFITTTSKTTDLIHTKQINNLKLETGIYTIACNDHYKEYIGETWKN